jgi:hypothetical protein
MRTIQIATIAPVSESTKAFEAYCLEADYHRITIDTDTGVETRGKRQEAFIGIDHVLKNGTIPPGSKLVVEHANPTSLVDWEGYDNPVFTGNKDQGSIVFWYR